MTHDKKDPAYHDLDADALDQARKMKPVRSAPRR
jgi:hypothetical protein